MDAATTVETPVRKKRNWWKYGFFVMLFLFEGAREIAVLNGDSQARPNVSDLLFSYGDPGFR